MKRSIVPCLALILVISSLVPCGVHAELPAKLLRSGLPGCVDAMDGKGTMTPENTLALMWLEGFYEGLKAANLLYSPSPEEQIPTIFPPEVSVGQLARAVVKYMDEHPEELDKIQFAALLVTKAIDQEWPEHFSRMMFWSKK